MIRILISLFFSTLILCAETTFGLTLPKKDIYLGESLLLTYTLKTAPTQPLTRIQHKAPIIQGARLIPLDTNQTAHSRRYHYMLIPEQTGTLLLPSHPIEVAHKDPTTYRNLWQTYRTAPLTLQIHPLPQGIQTVGNFTMQSRIDHNSTQANSPINFTITIQGKGLLDMLKPLRPDIQGVLLFSGKPEIRSSLQEGVYRSTLKQTFSLVGTEDFMIPPLQLQYLNSDTGIAETLSTKSYAISISNPQHRIRLRNYSLVFLSGLLAGILLLLGLRRYRRSSRAHTPLQKQLRRCKRDKTLYDLLLPYATHPQIEPILQQLEENLYHGAAHRIDRVALEKILRLLTHPIANGHL